MNIYQYFSVKVETTDDVGRNQQHQTKIYGRQLAVIDDGRNQQHQTKRYGSQRVVIKEGTFTIC